MKWPNKTDDAILGMAYYIYEEYVGRDNTKDLSFVAHHLQRRSDVPKEQAIRVLTRVQKEKMASGKYFPTLEEQNAEAKRWVFSTPSTY